MKEDDSFWELCPQCTSFKPVGWDCSCEFPPTEQDLAARPLNPDLVEVINSVLKEHSQWGKKPDNGDSQ
jgi:hypothetical protein